MDRDGHVSCNHTQSIDNLTDLGHAQYIHASNAALVSFDKQLREVVVGAGEIGALTTNSTGTASVLTDKFFKGTH